MKIKLIAILLFSSTFLSGCFERGKFTYVTTLEQTFPFTFSKSGEFNEVSQIKGNDIVRKILDLDLADDFIIKRVDIKSVRLGVKLNPGNTAKELDYRISVDDGKTGSRTVFLSEGGDTYISQGLATILSPVVDRWLNTEGAQKVKAFLTDILVGRSDIDGYTNDKVYNMEMNGNARGGAFIADVDLKLDIDITYETCEEVPIGFAEEECIF